MFRVPPNLKILFKRLLLILFLYTFSRLFFYFFNTSYFSDASAFSLAEMFFFGIRFDLYAIVITNSLFIILHLFPLKLFYTKGYQLLLKILFYFVNVISSIFNAVDFIYFKFTNKRTTADFFKLFGLGEDMGNTIPRIVADFWYILVIVILIFVIAGWIYNRITVKPDDFIKPGLIAWMMALPVIGLSVIAGRGGIQYVPLSILSASNYTKPQFTSLVLNTPFTIIKTLGKSELEEKRNFDEKSLDQYYTIRHDYKKDKSFETLNVVVIIMESFSKEYIGSLNNNQGYTPFLDSLISQSLVFENAYANGKKSMEGIPAVMASLPQLMSNPYITSAYNGCEMTTFASLLKKKHYSTWFFHGGINGTMGFDRFLKMGGFDHYIGRNEYPDPDDFDGNWGIYDEPFFRFFANSLDKADEPFMAGFFSLSSHHPYSVPDSLKTRFRKGPLPILESVMYADQSLKRFFESASKKEWFDHTLFVITADHTGPSLTPFYQGKVGMYAIPILFYMPGQIVPDRSFLTCQQADILPSVMDYLGYDLPFNSFGSSVFDTTEKHIAFNQIDGIYQLLSDSLILQYDGIVSTGLFNFTIDSLQTYNLVDSKKNIVAERTKTMQAIIQQYNNRLINNRLNKP